MAIKIFSPLNTIDETEPLILAGADEFYCGVLPDSWRSRYSVAASLNRRQEDNPVINTSPHFRSFDDLAAAVKIAHRHAVPVALTLNEHYYSNAQYPALIEYITQAIQTGIDAFIVGDIGILLKIKELAPGIHIHISTAGTAFNAETVRFYQDLGAVRVILPRHLSLEEIGAIAAQVHGIELEAFIFNSRCANVDGLCTFQHGLAAFVPDGTNKRDYENACMMLYRITASVKGYSDDEAEQILKEKVSWERQHFWSAMHIDERPCGACALYEFEEMGLAAVKIVGRGNTTERKLRDVRFFRQALDFLKNERPSKQAFRHYVRTLYRKEYERPCIIFKCYYPSVLLDDAQPSPPS
ncbi:MAG: U32 family peptidase [Desulfobacterota bacterium]|nr:U32 family peptidase [Thermodesulfobacteriota bacterium]